jgi:hypothetical protein
MKQDLCDITVVLDRSGSMFKLQDEVISAFNFFLDEQKKVEGDATFTLIQFDHQYEVIFEALNINEVVNLNQDTYVPRGITALLDAVGTAITSTGKRLAAMNERDRPSKVIFLIQTDGLENASKEFTAETVKKMISEQQDKYSWEFVFLGANIDAVSTATHLGIKERNAMTYFCSPGGTQDAFLSVSSNMASFRRGDKKDMSYEEKDFKAQEKAGVRK